MGNRKKWSSVLRIRFMLIVLSTTLCPELLSGEEWRHEELRRFKAPEANQGVAVDEEFFYAIDNRAIGKYRKTTGERIAGWESPQGGPLKHLNSGVVLAGKLYVSHSNYPELPEKSSIEIWDTETLEPIGRHEFQNNLGSLTWAVKHKEDWFVCFAHYLRTGDPSRSRVVRFDENWKELARWSFPAPLVARFAGYSASGGAFGIGGHLFVTGHDARELYVLDAEDGSSELIWRETIPISAAGQAFAWDPKQPEMMYSISRPSREVIVSRISVKP